MLMLQVDETGEVVRNTWEDCDLACPQVCFFVALPEEVLISVFPGGLPSGLNILKTIYFAERNPPKISMSIIKP